MDGTLVRAVGGDVGDREEETDGRKGSRTELLLFIRGFKIALRIDLVVP
jgi:hypothetical protein